MTTQEALYAEIDLELSWSERQLPQRERTKHVHALHPYLGKFVPQLVEALLARHFTRGAHVLDPFAGSGTALVQALESGFDATGVDVAAFNCLLMDVKTRDHDLERVRRELDAALVATDAVDYERLTPASTYLRRWFAPPAAAELLAWREAALRSPERDVLSVVLTRAARSARLTTHFDLDFPREPQRAPYWCFKHRRTCRPVQTAAGFLRRYADNTLKRLREFAAVRAPDRTARVVHADARTVELQSRFDGIVTSPPYPGLIDYHEQHRYAYELLGLPTREQQEIGSAAARATRPAVLAYSDAMVAALANARASLRPGSPVIVVVDDRRALYPSILERAGLVLEGRLRRHVNRRTGRRAGEFFEDVLLARA